METQRRIDFAACAQAYGTPLLVIDTDVLDAAIARFERLGRAHDIAVAYAAKALFFVALAERIAASELDVDVCSLGELLTAERGGVPAARIVFHGCGKTDEELDAALAGRIGRIVVDGAEELLRLAQRADSRAVGHRLDVIVRLNVGIVAATHEHVRTSGDDSKFGFPPAAVDGAIERVRATPALRFVGVHSHLGSQVFSGVDLVANVRALVAVAARAQSRGAAIGHIVAGGGFAVRSHPDEPQPDLAATLTALAGGFRAACAETGLAGARLGIEPGRAIVAQAGTSLYRVVAVKPHGARRFAIVDGSLADNPRPALYGAFHQPELVATGDGRAGATDFVETTVCGRSCESDRLVVAPLPADLRAGDLLALGTTGAYTFSMASNYNRFARPAVIFTGSGGQRAVVRRQSTEEVLRDDLT